MLLRIEQAKGRKDRLATLSPGLLDFLRDWHCIARTAVWLFPGRDPMLPMTGRQLTRAVHMAAKLAEINKRVSHATSQLCHPSVGAETRHSPDPGFARPCQVGDDRALRPGRSQRDQAVTSPLDQLTPLIPKQSWRPNYAALGVVFNVGVLVLYKYGPLIVHRFHSVPGRSAHSSSRYRCFDLFPPETFNLSFAGLSALYGVKIVLAAHTHPRAIFIESNVLRNSDTVFDNGLPSVAFASEAMDDFVEGLRSSGDIDENLFERRHRSHVGISGRALSN
jgi:hypothetical protein